MLLKRLSEYADQLDQPPPMYQRVPIRYVLRLDGAGRLLGRIEDWGDVKKKRGKEEVAPVTGTRTVAVTPRLLADTGEYVLGATRKEGKPERVQMLHQAFVALARECAEATGEPSVVAVAAFLTGFDFARDSVLLGLPEDFDASAITTFLVDDVFPFAAPAVRTFWARRASPTETVEAQCVVCGQRKPCVKRMPMMIKGISKGQSMGLALISANTSAFESFGLEASLIAPTCEECALRFGNALNALLRQTETHLNVGEVSYIFWAREAAPFSTSLLLGGAEPEEVRRFLTAAWRSKPGGAQLEVAPFYAATLSASVARVVIRDWIETTLGEAQRHLTRYFALQRLVGMDGDEHWFPLWQLVGATKRQGGHEAAAPQVGEALAHVALHGGVLPWWLLYQVVRRMRSEQGVKPWQAALVKMVVLSHHEGATEEEMSMAETESATTLADLAELERANRDPAYLCGRLLAELESLQQAAMPRVNTTIVDRFYGTASSAPATVFARLMRGAQPHLSLLRRNNNMGTYRAIEARLGEILSGLPVFPATLTLKQQGMFALGYYHQRVTNARAAQEGRERRMAQGASGDQGSAEAGAPMADEVAGA